MMNFALTGRECQHRELPAVGFTYIIIIIIIIIITL